MARWSWTLCAVVIASCGGVAPVDRGATVIVTGCGDGFAGNVAAIAVGPGLAVTVAHGVAQADGVVVEWRGSSHPAQVVVYDGRSDLALLAVPGLEVDEVELGVPAEGSAVTMVGGLASATVSLEVSETLTIRIEEVLGTRRVERAGLRLTGPAVVGDSGAGLFDTSGALVGVVFAVSDEGSGEVWASAATEIEALLDAPAGTWACDPARSRLVDVTHG